MDLWIYLRNGTVAPITGCTAVASIDLVGTSVSLAVTATISTVLLTVSSTTGIVVGMRVSGVGIPELTTVVGVPSATTVTISNPVSAGIAGAFVSFVGPSVADQKLLSQNSGVYRDLFSTDLAVTIAGVGTSSTISGSLPGMGVLTETNPGGVALTGTPTLTEESDVVAHIPPRQINWYEALWQFTCTVTEETITMDFLKKDVIGWGNVEPDL